MWLIDEEFTDYYSVPGGTRIAHLRLKADKNINSFNITYPIKWTGFLAGHAVEIVQHDIASQTLADFKFNVFPSQYSEMKHEAVQWIDKFLKRTLS